MMVATKFDAETGEELIRDIRPITITYHGYSKTFPMPGWYPKNSNEGTFTFDDMNVYDEAMEELKSRIDYMPMTAQM